MTRVCGVDHGTHDAGIVVLDQRGEVLYRAQVRLHGDHPAGRLACLKRRMEEAMGFWHCTILAAEQPIHHSRLRNQGAAWVGQAFGVLAVHAYEQGWTWLEVNPTAAKVALTGAGGATKTMMQDCAAVRWPDRGAWGPDEADAGGVALAALGMVREAALLAGAGAGKGGKR